MKNIYFLLFALLILPFTVNAQFVENRGQFSHREISKLRPDIQYQLTGSKVISYFLNDGIENYFYKVRDAARENWSEDLLNDEAMGYEIKIPQDIFFYRFDIRFLNANDNMQMVAVDKNKTYRNYYYEFCPDGILFVPDYKSIEYQNLYHNIDLRYITREGKVKYEFVLYPGALVSDIKMQYQGVDNLRINDNGDLVYDIAGEEMIEEKPYSFYSAGGQEIVSKYIIEEDNTVSFILDGIDLIDQNLIIDPVLTWSTYFQGVYGGYQYNPGVDDDGNIFICTQDGAGTLPVLNAGSGQWYQGTEVGPSPNWDLAIFKFNNDLSLAWCTYYGGMGCEEGWGRRNVAYDNDNDRVYFSGETDTPYSNSVQTFPTYDPGSGAFYQDVSYDNGASYPFFIQMTPDGVREWATLFTYENPPFTGGMGTDIESIYYQNGYLYFAGETNKYSHSGIPLRTLAGAYNNSFYCGGVVPFVGRFNTNRALQWCTYINNGIATSSFSTGCVDMVVDESNNIYIVNDYSEYSGSGISNLLPLVNPGGGAYYQSTAASFGTSRRGNHLVKLNPASSSVLWGTFIQGTTYSGSWPDFASCLAVDGNSNLFMGFRGMYSSNFPVTNLSGAYNQAARYSTTGSDGGLVKFSSTGVKLWGTYLNGSSHPTTSTAVNDIDIYPDNTFIIIGNTACSDFPIVNLSGSYNKSTITTAGTTEGFISKFGTDCAMDWSTYFPIGYGYGAVTYTDCDVRYVVDNSGGSNVPLVNPGSPAYYSSTVQNYQSFQVFEDQTAVASVAASSINASATSICVGSSVTLSVNGGSLGTGASWNWYSGSCGGTLIGTGSSIVVSPSSSTTYYVRAEGDCDISGCVARAITVNAIPTVSASASPTTICAGSSTTLTGSGASTYSWNSGGSGTTTSVSPSSNTTYTVTGTSNGCTNTANVSVTVTPLPSVSASATVSPICAGSSTTISATGASTYSWSNSLGSNSSYSVSPG
ncbi:MAG: hypothetical protein JXR53_06800, partial [Bacteroidales bacterium]|nr:hypothetical protein [Bacteroidales bacterium]